MVRAVILFLNLGTSGAPWKASDNAFIVAAILSATLAFALAAIFIPRISLSKRFNLVKARSPNNIILSVVVLEDQMPSLRLHAPVKSRIRAPYWFVMDFDGSQLRLWRGRRPDLAAVYSANTESFSLGNISTWSQNIRAIKIQEPGSWGEDFALTFLPIHHEAKSLFPQKMTPDEVLEIIKQLAQHEPVG